jgi:hypothetical protein
MKSKLIAIIAFAGMGLFAEGVFAQGNDQTEQQTTPPPVTDENATSTETEPYNETVTIDSGTDSTAAPAATETAVQPERKEKLRVYSGKHDGNNVIVDPR